MSGLSGLSGLLLLSLLTPAAPNWISPDCLEKLRNGEKCKEIRFPSYFYPRILVLILMRWLMMLVPIKVSPLSEASIYSVYFIKSIRASYHIACNESCCQHCKVRQRILECPFSLGVWSEWSTRLVFPLSALNLLAFLLLVNIPSLLQTERQSVFFILMMSSFYQIS